MKDLYVLEIGCGNGGGAKFASEQFKPKKYFALDVSENIIKNNIRKFKNVPNLYFDIGDGENLLFNAELFDVAINIQVLHHIGNIKTFAFQLSRVLKVDGELLLADFLAAKQVQKVI